MWKRGRKRGVDMKELILRQCELLEGVALTQAMQLQVFPADIIFSAGNNNPDSHHLQGGMTFATQISPLLNLCLPM